ncbi:ParB N-terminal domain-containing protein [Brevibacillus sp. HB2.2]|uniref:ParB N-terminal domain-containing protein n=1 Tax=Brevibacillus sp. HB2.2 TaxID=2738846 RepID=UPI0035C19173
MDIRKIPLSKINPAPYNPRIDLQPGDIEYEKLKRSIEEFGCVETLVWNERTGNLVGGHQRFKILVNELGSTEVNVSVVDLDDIREKALNIALNKISVAWDEEMLAQVLAELQESDLDVELTGFDLEDQ